MFDRTSWYTDLIDQLQKTNQDAEAMDRNQLRLLFQVELGLYLLEELELLDEPITVLWAVLSGLPFPRLSRLEASQHRMISIARFMLPFTGRFPWHEALKSYARLPQSTRAYVVTRDPLDEQLVVNARIQGQFDESRLGVYATVLAEPINHRRNPRSYVEAGSVRFDVYTRHGKQSATVDIPFDSVKDLESPPIMEAKNGREPLVITHEKLVQTAAVLDENLAHKGLSPSWQHRLDQYIHYHAFNGDELTQEANQLPLRCEGITHVVGMVGSGKSTLMKLIAAYLHLFEQGKTIALVVGDTMTVFDMVHEFNELLADNDHPIAVPLIGRTTRDQHLQRFYSSGNDPNSQWIPRWINTTCPLMGLIPPEQAVLLPGEIIPGREPCEQLDMSAPDDDRRRFRLCPFFNQCPSQLVWQDIPGATIYITTPGALAKSSIPTQFEGRRLKYGEFIYEQCDVVIFDEADTVLEWFDNEYASVIDLWGKHSAIFNLADVAAAASLAVGTTRAEERWVRAERHTTEAIVNILRQLSGGGDASTLRRWIGGRYFTAFNLFNRLARRILGIWDYTPEEEIPVSIQERLLPLLECFDQMIEGDPLNLRRPRMDEDQPAYRLSQIMGRALAHGADAIIEDCEDWIDEFVPDYGVMLTRLNEQLCEKSEPEENLHTVAVKLALAINVALLDRNIRIVFYEWYNQPDAVDREIGAQPYRPSEMALSDALAIPPTGRIFGTYYARSPEEDGDASTALARFEYANVGRLYLLRYHQLLNDIGIPGPNVLALSATSWLPDSTRWHVDIKPQGVLQAPELARTRITNGSQFAFRPQYTDEGMPINISGARDKIAAVKSLAKAMMQSREVEHELGMLARLAHDEPEQWGGRERILFLTNSYAQARAFAETLGVFCSDKSEIFYLSRPDQADAEELFSVGSIPRGEIERFALTTGRILVAPMNAIGRGYNILNRERTKAAFGSVYFLVRPMPHPYDIQALAGELNARTLSWCQDENFEIWQHPRLAEQSSEFRRFAKNYWAKSEMRRFYSDLTREERRDLAATSLGKMVQASGRLLRGGVPFHAIFVDSKWAPNSAVAPDDLPLNAELDSPKDSLLTQMVMLLEEYSDEYIIGNCLYEPFAGLLEMEGFYPKREDV